MPVWEANPLTTIPTWAAALVSRNNLDDTVPAAVSPKLPAAVNLAFCVPPKYHTKSSVLLAIDSNWLLLYPNPEEFVPS